ncbi:hypothetical protein DVU_1915 [Nitratidesulfovibrio vulgaris str. Hildenborough]|uniref:Uncharacterized protein n=1 Tax=Nitratidesulfovibrio vulgaris (strain ATCC 29579 / DSM 644 / CCUG 34227 / NCIMB 8303 / VKM B-1760 / Hildenborough) TaxID=882 RepID=Q72AS6_NITV2|nr:hypothetical protein DVU_1915 [Nitratidesulfovibrio vulgaris str. Hildenborough]
MSDLCHSRKVGAKKACDRWGKLFVKYIARIGGAAREDGQPPRSPPSAFVLVGGMSICGWGMVDEASTSTNTAVSWMSQECGGASEDALVGM